VHQEVKGNMLAMGGFDGRLATGFMGIMDKRAGVAALSA
jgi:hypothetical protein